MDLNELPLAPGECIVLVRHKGTVIAVQGIARQWTYSERVEGVPYWSVEDPFDVRYARTNRTRELQLDMTAMKVAAVSVDWDDLYERTEPDPVLPRPRLGDGSRDGTNH